MSETLFNIDLSIFYFINHTIANPILDFLFPIITNGGYWLPVYAVVIIYLLWKGGTKGRICALLLIVGVIISDQTSSHLLKNLFLRYRPFDYLPDVRKLVGAGGKSFPSSHSVNNFCAAFILSFFYKKRQIIFYSIAGTIAFTRVYVGVHYPSDVLGGILIGLLLGYLIIKSALYLSIRIFKYNIVERLQLQQYLSIKN
jgi:undecaprenyl-diphosphatase